LGVAGASEEAGVLRDEMDMAAFLDNASLEGAIEAPVAVDLAIYRDYYDMFGTLLFLHLMWIF
jgi:hypothetical protein